MADSRTFTWLHLSDLHARTTGGWDAKRVTSALVEDLKEMSEKHGLQPDCIFFTGDAAFGSIDGEKMPDQYQKVKAFFEEVRQAFDEEIPLRRLYLVPGNHDVDRAEVTPEQTEWLRHSSRSLLEIHDIMQKQPKQWRQWMERLLAYRNFINLYGLTHLGYDDPHLIWGDAIEVHGMRIGIAGFNTAWSCRDNGDKSHLWFGGDYQAASIKEKIGPVDFTIALLHHPSNWFTMHEDPHVLRRLRQDFPLMLHGHEHLDWVDKNDDYHCLISAGACYESSWMENGYSFGRLDLDKAEGSLWLRRWDKSSGWVAANKKGKTVDGVWSLGSLQWLRPTKNSVEPKTPSCSSPHVEAVQTGASAEEHYTTKFCEHVITHHNVLELFGCDIPRDVQKHELSVAYVSLNLSASPEKKKDKVKPTRGKKKKTHSEADAGDDSDDLLELSASVDDAMDRACEASGRLMIVGPAGAGKTTLLRWCAIQAASGALNGPAPDIRTAIERHPPAVTEEWREFKDANSWRLKIPVLIRLRDCTDGKLPAANDLPRFLAKHLPTPPTDWMTHVFDSGRALILLDGVDEVNRDHRPELAEEIESLIKTYPRCTYVVTTRPGAVEPGWLEQLDFTEAHVQAMTRRDRSEFIDKWFHSASLVIRNLRPGEDLVTTADSLKAELDDRPELGILATNPLLCAMICALYRERQDQLPETPAELSEALCQMLLHRRERETPGLKGGKHFPESWRELQYEQKKGLLAQLAWSMLTGDDTSSIAIGKAEEVVRQVLSSTPGRTEDEAVEITQALIERSGLLRLASDERIDFLHNTLKEFLAAGHAVALSHWELLSEKAEDPAWQPVILFGLALAPEPFSTSLVSVLLNKLDDTPRPRKQRGRPLTNKKEKSEFASNKSKEFFLVRCRASAKRLASGYSSRIDDIAAALFPPAHMADVDALAQLGPRWLLHAGKSLLNPDWWKQPHSTQILLRCLRLLRLIGGPRAKTAFKAIRNLPENFGQLTCEWMLGASELHPGVTLHWPFPRTDGLFLTSRMVSDLRPLAAVTKIKSLYIHTTNIRDLDGIRHLKEIEVLCVNACYELINIDALASMRRLETLAAWGCNKLTSLEGLSGLRAIKELFLSGCHSLRSLRGIENSQALEKLDIRHCVSFDDYAMLPLANSQFPKLETLQTNGCRHLTNFTWRQIGAAAFKSLSHLSVGGPNSTFDDESLELLKPHFPKLATLAVEECENLTSLNSFCDTNLSKLESLSLYGCESLTNLEPLANAKPAALKNLNISGCRGLTDLSPLFELDLSHLQQLRISGLSNQVRMDVGKLKRLLPRDCAINGLWDNGT